MNILHIIFPLLLAVIPVAASQADNKAPALRDYEPGSGVPQRPYERKSLQCDGL